MRSVDEIRRLKLRALVVEYGTLKALSESLDRSDTQVSGWVNAAKDSRTGKPRGMRSSTARWIEKKLRKPPGWLDSEEDLFPSEVDERKKLAHEILDDIPHDKLDPILDMLVSVRALLNDNSK